MRVYKSPFVGTALGTRRRSLAGWQWLSKSRVESATRLKADWVACLDGKKRMKQHFEMLKAQVDAGTYYVDSYAIACKMLQAGDGDILKTDDKRCQTLSIYPSSVLPHHF